MARAQERELREWLYDDRSRAGDVPGGRRCGRSSAEVEDGRARSRSTPSSWATRARTTDTEALLQATREALVNAVVHGRPPVSRVPRGRRRRRPRCSSGTAATASTSTPCRSDRFGVRESILGRVRRRGGTATVTSPAGRGTEVRLRVPVPPATREQADGQRRAAAPSTGGTRTHERAAQDGGTRRRRRAAGRAAGGRGPGGRPPHVPHRCARLARRPGRTSSGRPTTSTSAVAQVRTLTPPVVLLDVHLPGGNGGGGAEVITACTDLLATARFLALSVSDAAEDVVAVIRAGARGYVTKAISGPELSDAVVRVAGGDAVFSPRLAGFVLDAFGTSAADVAIADDELDRLSARERRSCGSSPAATATARSRASCSSRSRPWRPTCRAVLRKLQLSSRHELTRWAAARRQAALNRPSTRRLPRTGRAAARATATEVSWARQRRYVECGVSAGLMAFAPADNPALNELVPPRPGERRTTSPTTMTAGGRTPAAAARVGDRRRGCRP